MSSIEIAAQHLEHFTVGRTCDILIESTAILARSQASRVEKCVVCLIWCGSVAQRLSLPQAALAQ